eukprot:TRINITY_DN58926_c0_g1_i1.p1 TRINITY_DN58926_c0_g1~~TRINITY_DN58926_c0_g1_i1.p1  ORF type:complete len:742 (-),score=159.56 TRINITY_DN58926_c0_g1_i1:22-2217(-)
MEVERNGSLQIKPNSLCNISCITGWPEREFRLKKRELKWYSGESLEGTLLPDDVSGVEELPPLILNVISTGRVYTLKAKSVDDMRAWSEAITKALVPAAASKRGRSIRIEVLHAVDLLNTQAIGEMIETKIANGVKMVAGAVASVAGAAVGAATSKGESKKQDGDPLLVDTAAEDAAQDKGASDDKDKTDAKGEPDTAENTSKIKMFGQFIGDRMDFNRFCQKMDVVVRVRIHHTKVASTPPAWNQGVNPTFDWACTFAYENETHIDFDLYDKDLLDEGDIIGTGRIAIEKAGVGWKTPVQVNIYFYKDRSSVFAGILFVKAEFLDYGEMKEEPVPSPEAAAKIAEAKQVLEERMAVGKAAAVTLPDVDSAAAAATTEAEGSANAPEEAQAEPSLYHFKDLHLQDIDQDAFKEELRGNLRNSGISEDDLEKVRIELRPGSVVAVLYGPVSAVAKIQKEVVPDALQVMGCAAGSKEEPWHEVAAREEIEAGAPESEAPPPSESESSDWAVSICPNGSRDFVKKTLRELGLVTNDDLRQFWKILDYNGNNVVSLAEVDKLVVEFVASKVWPGWLNNKPALLMAFNDRKDKSCGGGQIAGKKANVAAALMRKHELQYLLGGLIWYNHVWSVFDLIDEGDDRRIEEDEFVDAMPRLGVSGSREQFLAEFAKIDVNGGGKILFGEFCVYLKSQTSNPGNKANPPHMKELAESDDKADIQIEPPKSKWSRFSAVDRE